MENKAAPPAYDEIWAHIETLPWSALVTTGRSGTDFLQSLLDSHPEIAVYNGAHFFYAFWDGAQTVNYGGPLKAAHILDEYIGAFIDKLIGRYDRTERKAELGDDGDQEIAVDVNEFRRHALGLLGRREPSARNFLIAIVAAFDMCLGRDMMGKKTFLHHSHRIGRTHRFLEEFPGSKVVCMIRDPRAHLVSGVEHWRRYEPNTDNPAYPIYVVWRALDEMAEFAYLPPERVAAMRLEDLGDRATLDAFCAWLGISYHPCMENSTWGGLRWWGDRLSDRKTPREERGFSPTMIANRWQSRLLAYDRFVLNHVLRPMTDRYGYAPGPGSHPAWAPLVALLILLPSTYEWRFLSPRFLLGKAAKGQVRGVLRSFWHPLRRMRLYFRWLIRRHFGTYFAPKQISGAPDGPARG